MKSAREGAQALAEALRERGGTVAEALRDGARPDCDSPDCDSPDGARPDGDAADAAHVAHVADAAHAADTAHPAHAADSAGWEPGPPQRAASGPRVAGHEADYELLLEMILEGSRLHYGGARVVSDDDPDLALLLGDQLYALGLSRLAELGDLPAIAELADLISLEAAARAAGDLALADAIWRAGATAVGWGAPDGHARAKALVRGGDQDARRALEESAQAPAGRRAS